MFEKLLYWLGKSKKGNRVYLSRVLNPEIKVRLYCRLCFGKQCDKCATGYETAWVPLDDLIKYMTGEDPIKFEPKKKIYTE